MDDWQPVRIAPREHVLRFHFIDPGEVSKWNRTEILTGKIIRVRPSEEAWQELQAEHRLHLKCNARMFVEVHPGDAHSLWPEHEGSYIGLCEYQILAD